MFAGLSSIWLSSVSEGDKVFEFAFYNNANGNINRANVSSDEVGFEFKLDVFALFEDRNVCHISSTNKTIRTFEKLNTE